MSTSKEEFKEMLKECFSLSVSVGWNERLSDWCLKIEICDNDTSEIILKGEIPTYALKE